MRQFCTFYVAGQAFGIDADRVKEVIRFQPITPVPLAPPTVRGLMNLRGQIVTTIDLRRRLDMGALAEGARPINVVLDIEGDLVSFLVDKVGDVLHVSEDSYESVPETLAPAAKRLIEGAYKLDKELLLVLNDARAADCTLKGT
jgi:purine-binding chemotaxis protein CheW